MGLNLDALRDNSRRLPPSPSSRFGAESSTSSRSTARASRTACTSPARPPRRTAPPSTNTASPTSSTATPSSSQLLRARSSHKSSGSRIPPARTSRASSSTASTSSAPPTATADASSCTVPKASAEAPPSPSPTSCGATAIPTSARSPASRLSAASPTEHGIHLPDAPVAQARGRRRRPGGGVTVCIARPALRTRPEVPRRQTPRDTLRRRARREGAFVISTASGNAYAWIGPSASTTRTATRAHVRATTARVRWIGRYPRRGRGQGQEMTRR